MLDLAWGVSTHAGRVRRRNEDAVLARPPLFAVADGMGGHDAGDVASGTVVTSLSRLVDAGPLSRQAVLDAVREADQALIRLGASTGRTLGTTVCGLAVLTSTCGDQRLVLVNVGDSRGYRLRAGQLEQLTHDHSVVQELLDAGAINRVAAAGHPDRHIVTRSLGGPEYLEIDWWLLDAAAGDRYLLASDGLTTELADGAIRAVLAREVDPAAAASALVDRALAGGGRDNISTVVVDVTAVAAGPVPDPLDVDTHPRPVGGGAPPPRWRGPDPLEAETEPWAGRALYADTDPMSDP